MAVYDGTGRKVRDLYLGDMPDSVLRVRWDGRGNDGAVAGVGVYFCRVKVNGTTAVMEKLIKM